eukprot:gene3656-7284_t
MYHVSQEKDIPWDIQVDYRKSSDNKLGLFNIGNISNTKAANNIVNIQHIKQLKFNKAFNAKWISKRVTTGK